MNFLSQIQDNESWLFEDEAEMPEIEKMDDFFASPVPQFVPDFSKGLEENFTMEKQMQATATLGSTAPQGILETEEHPCDAESAKSEMDEEVQSLQGELSACDPHKNAEFISTYSAVGERVHIQNIDELIDDSSYDDISDGEDYLIKGKRSGFFPRWGKANDKRLFELLRKFESEGRLTMDYPYGERGPKRKAVFKELIRLSGWKGTKRRLVARIQMVQRNSAFSVREIKLLKRVLKRDYRNKPINYERILSDFPGKSRQHLIEVCREIRASKKSKGSLRKRKY